MSLAPDVAAQISLVKMPEPIALTVTGLTGSGKVYWAMIAGGSFQAWMQ
jgi:hypothetical protein